MADILTVAAGVLLAMLALPAMFLILRILWELSKLWSTWTWDVLNGR